MSTSGSRPQPICVDLFCGAGGLSQGLQEAGFRTVFSVDFDKDAITTYRRNHPGVTAVQRDVANVTGGEISEAAGGQEVDLLCGGPSCQGYSTHGKRKEADPRNFHFQHFIRLIREIQPKWTLMENVPGLLTYRGGHFRRVITEAFSSAGYTVSSAVLCAADFGVPQLRRRIFFLGTRTGLPISFPEPTHGANPEGQPRVSLFQSQPLRPYVTVKEAIGDLPLMKGELNREDWEYAAPPSSEFQRYARRHSRHLTLHQANGLSEQSRGVVKFIKQGEGLRAVPVEHLPARFKKMRTISTGDLRRDCTTLYHRPHEERPAYTITCYFRNVASGPFLHPLEDRSLSYREAARLMSFRDNYEFVGHGLPRQIGNAVPPLLARALGRHILQLLSGADITEGMEVSEQAAAV